MRTSLNSSRREEREELEMRTSRREFLIRGHGSKRGLRVESPMAADELTCWAETKNQTFKVKYCESDIVSN